MSEVFDTTVRRPWCALEFGSVDYCDKATGDRARPTNAELWLQYPAQGWQRGRLHTLMDKKQGDHFNFDPIHNTKTLLGINDDRKLPDDVEALVHRDPPRASIQNAGGTFPRLALLAVVLVGLSGAVALYSYLGIRLILAAGLGLVLLLIAPPMLLAPALGDGGRATFLTWLKRLLAATVAKFIYAIFLTVVLVASRVFSSLEFGWFGTWLMSAAFWWGVFVKRHDIINFVAGGVPHQHGDGLGRALSHGYYAWMLGRGVKQVAARAGAPVAAGGETIRAGRQDRQEARAAATRSLATERLEDRHRQELQTGQEQARGVVTQRESLQRELRATDRRLAGHDEAVAVANATKSKPPAPNAEQRQLIEHRDHLRHLLSDPVAAEAEQTVRHADRNRALTGDSVTHRDLEVHRARRLAELRDERTPETHEERDLLAAAQAGAGDRAAQERGQRWLDDDELKRRRAEELAEIRARRRRQRTGRGRR
jgi:hypothetical protein